MSCSFHKALTERDLEMRSEVRVGDNTRNPKLGRQKWDDKGLKAIFRQVWSLRLVWLNDNHHPLKKGEKRK